MASQVLGWYARHERRIVWTFFAFFLVMFSYAVLDALALLPGEPGFHPGRGVALGGALLIQSIARLLQPQFSWVSIAVTVLSLVVLAGGMAPRRLTATPSCRPSPVGRAQYRKRTTKEIRCDVRWRDCSWRLRPSARW
jgi:hypothetical protein